MRSLSGGASPLSATLSYGGTEQSLPAAVHWHEQAGLCALSLEEGRVKSHGAAVGLMWPRPQRILGRTCVPGLVAVWDT